MITGLLRRHLWSGPARSPEEARAFGVRAHLRSLIVIRLYYAAGLLWVAQSMSRWPALRTNPTIDPLWPAGWVDRVGTGRGITAILVAYAVTSTAAAAAPRWRILRLAYVVSLLQFMAVDNGLGKIGHGLHGWLWVGAVLVLAPTGRQAWGPEAPPADRQAFLNVIRLSQAVLLFFYSLTGMWKVWYSAVALVGPGVSGFAPDGFSYIVGQNLLATGQPSLVGDLLVDQPLLGWVLFNATTYLELSSLVVVFRPRLHRLWGIGLILFHLGTQAALSISFSPNIVLLGLLMVCSPFVPDDLDVRSTVRDLPGIHLARSLLDGVRSGPRPSVRPLPRP